MSWYRAGTVAVTNGSKTVTGVGTLFTTAVNAGDAFALVDANLNPTGAWYEVESVTNNTTLVLKQSYAGSTGSNKQYCVFNLVGNMTTPSFAQRLATFFASFQSLIDKPTTTPTALGIPVADENGKLDSGWIKEATETVKGVVKVGANINVDEGVVSVPDATDTVKGVVKVGANINVDEGVVSVPEATDTVKGVIELATDAEVIQGTDTERAITPAGLLAGFPTRLRSNLLGTVSQTGGVPTGAVIESGSNANGSYVKFADGTMICTQNISFANNGLSFTQAASSNWWAIVYLTLPATFSANPRGLSAIVRNGTGLGWASVRDVSTTSIQIGIYDDADRSGDEIMYSYTAIGRWF